MDRGAARSRKRADKTSKPQAGPAPSGTSAPPPPPARSGPSTTGKPGRPGKPNRTGEPDETGKHSKHDKHDKRRKHKTGEHGKGAQLEGGQPAAPARKPFERPAAPELGPDGRPKQDRDPSHYRPKAVRTSAALVYGQTPFALPVPAAQLAGVRRLDLEGSGATDVAWLAGSGVTWLSLKGCPVRAGWEAVAGLTELSVLNISGCGLTALPPALKGLGKLKALVAMDNPWSTLDADVVGGWTELNSLILSHSPALSALPPTLSTLAHLAKLSLSHSPRLTSPALPDLSALPLLRDVKLNNLPRLAALPPHLARWGTGELARAHPTKTGAGDGLEVLDLGNCGLSYAAVAPVFGLDAAPTPAAKAGKAGTAATAGKAKGKAARWPQLRSITLHSNPLALERPDYAAALQAAAAAGALPKLQIIDARRVVERSRKGEVQESRVERRRREKREGRRATGANVDVGAGRPMRAWGGGDGGAEAGDGASGGEGEGGGGALEGGAEGHAGKGKKRKREGEGGGADAAAGAAGKGKAAGADAAAGAAGKGKAAGPVDSGTDARPAKGKPGKPVKRVAEAAAPSAGGAARPPKKARRDGKPAASAAAPAAAPAPAPAPAPSTAKLADLSAAVPAKPSRTQTAVVNVIDERAKRRDGPAPPDGGVDLRAVFGRRDDGLGAGGW